MNTYYLVKYRKTLDGVWQDWKTTKSCVRQDQANWEQESLRHILSDNRKRANDIWDYEVTIEENTIIG